MRYNALLCLTYKAVTFKYSDRDSHHGEPTFSIPKRTTNAVKSDISSDEWSYVRKIVILGGVHWKTSKQELNHSNTK